MKLSQGFLISLLVVLLFSDIVYSFYQHLQMPLDGDIAESVLPDAFVYKVLSDPFGVNVLLNKESYPNPNRFFAHGSMLFYMRQAPVLFQHFVSPIDSVYVSCAFMKTITQCMLILLVSVMINGMRRKISWSEIALSAILITPLFQTAGYNRYMGVIDQSTAYTFFYAWPFMLLLTFLLPIYFYLNSINKYSISVRWKILMIILAIVLPFSSPLLPGVIVIVSTLFFLHVILSQPDFSFKNISAKKLLRTFQNLPRFIVFILLLISALSLYSLYIGSFNSSNGLETISLTERYLKLPRGLFRIFTQKPGWLMVLGVTVLNSVILWYIKSIYGRKKILISLKWIFIFSLLYVLLLPMGGFREYRSNIIRYDTFLPITLCFIYYFGVSTIVVLRHKTLRFQKIYIVCITFILVAFTSADKIKGEGNTCEKWALGVIAASKTEPVLLNTDCTILSWHIISDFRESEGNAAVLKIWGITKKPMRYFQKNDLANSKFK